jgi:phenylalanyl-tRNA synthetase beta chain
MKFSYRWIKDLVPGLDADRFELMRLITVRTAECEGFENAGMTRDDASVALVTDVEAVAGSHNQIATLETKRYGTKRVVCGAPNCKPGMLTAYLPLPPKVIDGVESDGMLASALDLGLGRDNSGIVELDRPELPEADTIIEVDNKSLTHRPDLWGHHGMAREVAAITHGALSDPVKPDLLPQGESPVAIAIEDFALCPRYSALVFENVTVRPSPLWLQYRLEAIGLNAINNIVDVTNYVMAELAQPMHAFDAEKLHGPTIFIRSARIGEQIVALNDEGYNLTASNLVIADAEGPIALAGVIGGLHSAIGTDTKRIVLESANFQAASVRKTSVALKLRTDASMRFEKSQDPLNTVRGLARAVELLREVSPGIRLVGGLADSHGELKTPAPIELTVEWLKAKLGRDLDAQQVRSILESLEFGVEESTPGHFRVTVPSWRATKDISIKDDLLEEVGRMLGYESITPRAPLIESVVPPQSPSRLYLRGVRNMAVDQGFTEVYNYSFVTEEMVRAFDMDVTAHVGVTNPIASDQTLLRSSLLPAIRRNILDNSRHFQTFRLFEIGREIHVRNRELPEEIPHFVAAMYAREGDGSALLFELKRLAECLMNGCQARLSEPRPFEHPERAATITWQGEDVGRLFELHPSLGVEGRAAILNLDLSTMDRLSASQEKRYQALRRFPTSNFDITVQVPSRVTAGLIEQELTKAAGSNLVEIKFLYVYAEPPVPEGHKALTYRLTVGAQDHTLSPEETTAIYEAIQTHVRSNAHAWDRQSTR